MYKDYYAIFEIHFAASQDEIKTKYRTLVKKWHPDVNKNVDATSRMQEIIEAYLILNDIEARNHYNKIHLFYFRQRKNEVKDGHLQQEENTNSENKTSRAASEPVDIVLDNWILKANQQAKEFILQSLNDAARITLNGFKFTTYAIVITIILFFIILIIAFLIGLTR